MAELEITAPELASLLASPPKGFVLLDVREPWECELAKLPAATFIPMGELPARANQELHPDAPIVTMCHSGVRSMSVAVWLKEQGFEDVRSLRGGIDAWSRDIDPQVARY